MPIFLSLDDIPISSYSPTIVYLTTQTPMHFTIKCLLNFNLHVGDFLFIIPLSNVFVCSSKVSAPLSKVVSRNYAMLRSRVCMHSTQSQQSWYFLQLHIQIQYLIKACIISFLQKKSQDAKREKEGVWQKGHD